MPHFVQHWNSKSKAHIGMIQVGSNWKKSLEVIAVGAAI